MILAGFFDFGVGEAIKGISDATWKVMAIKAIERLAPSILLMTCVIGAIVSAWGAAYIAIRIFEADAEAMRDGKITIGEWVLFAARVLIGVPTIVGLLWFSWFLARASQHGLLELMK